MEGLPWNRRDRPLSFHFSSDTLYHIPAPSPQNMIRGWKIALRSFAVPSSWLLKEGAQSGGEYAIFY